ncbi:acyl carrier protein [Actinoplanes italicus]|jgi:acyl carrier protein|uniref:Acyl carrier protein n=1 Tax=Actinoplanes italicus TaxID=113567 RepID=A0A2T0K7T0_9ACTN|nr:phosphopantetheine-binding protein [Actinoplanes italicus]PRX19078.1 acyl carrier protein [Actinoplanes italicus]GIE32345.1 acyl carrier protein [Actinoplanes italicus]
MNREQIVEHIRVALATVLDRKIPQLDADARLVEDLGLDSTTVVELMMALEDSIGLEVDLDELEPEVFSTVATLADFMRAEALGPVS